MADMFNKVLSNFCNSFISIKKRTDLTIHGTGMNTAMINLKKYTKNDTKLYNREMDIMTPLWNALGLAVPTDISSQIKRAKNIQVCLDNLAKHKLIIGSVFVGAGTAKYWKQMSAFCKKSIIEPLEHFGIKGEEAIKVVNNIDKKLSKLSNDATMKSKDKDQHNKDAEVIFNLWNKTIGSNGEGIVNAYKGLSPKDFESIYTIISTIVKPKSGTLFKLMMYNGRNVSDNMYFNLYSAVKDVQKNWNSYKK